MNIEIILGILLIHWFADFVLQTNWQAHNKSSSMKALVSHTANYSSFWAVVWVLWVPKEIIIFKFMPMVYFVFITFILHTITDYFTSRINKKLWTRKKVHSFFISVGFDQFLHYTQLFLTYIYIYNG